MPERSLLDLVDGDDVLAALRTVDEGSLYFTPLGLGGPQPPGAGGAALRVTQDAARRGYSRRVSTRSDYAESRMDRPASSRSW
jgi:hypothetical protein